MQFQIPRATRARGSLRPTQILLKATDVQGEIWLKALDEAVVSRKLQSLIIETDDDLVVMRPQWKEVD